MNPPNEKILSTETEINRALATYKLVSISDVQNAYNAYTDVHQQQIFCDEQFLERFYQNAKNAFRDAQEVKNKSDNKSVKTTLHGLKKIGYGIAFSGLAYLNWKTVYAEQHIQSQLPNYYFEYITGICALTGLNFLLSGIWKTYKGIRYRANARNIFELAQQNKSNIAFKAHNIIALKFSEDAPARTAQEQERLHYLKWLWQKRIGILANSGKKNGKENNDQNGANQPS